MKQLTTTLFFLTLVSYIVIPKWQLIARLLKPRRLVSRLNRKDRMIPVPLAAAILDPMTFSWVCHSQFYRFFKTCHKTKQNKIKNSAMIENSQTRASLGYWEARGFHVWDASGNMLHVASSGLFGDLPTRHKPNCSFN